MIDVATLKPQATPKHEGSGLAFWLDERFLVRAVWEDRRDGELWVYDHRSNEEMRVPTAERFSVGLIQPVSEDGRLLAWIDNEQEASVQKIRLWNLEAQKEQGSARVLPDAVNWAGHGANWTADGGIAVYGRGKSEQGDSEDGYELHVFHISRDRDEIFHLKSPCPAGRWYPCPNWRYALGASKAKRGKSEVTLVDFKKGTLIAVGNGFHADALPLRLAEYLYWVKRENGKACLVRLEYASMRESVVCPVSCDMAVEAVTENGRLALLGLSRESLFGFPAYQVVQTATGKRHRIRPPGFGRFRQVAFWTGCPAMMPLSPDGRMLAVQSRGPGYLTTLLYKVPPEWVGPYDASGSAFTR
ncbi:MAG: hypothetical protein JSU94_20570 [Phycisphaerales bacterium]|nr:MAG: hypothetical protein JSU94_20570 [Phycisphaerales bacterium]